MYQEGLTLLTDPTTPTRTGTSSCRDTCPDLTFVKNVKDAKWENTNENLGSDHFILETTATCTSVKPRKLGQVKIIEWDKWREHRGVSTSTIEDIGSWTREAVSSTAAYTKVLTVDEETPCVDPPLLHMWDARRSLTKRWKNQRLNRKLKIKIQEINHKAEEYAAELTRQNWYNLCDSIQGRLNSATQRISQIKRLSETPNGRWLLERLQLATPGGILHQEPKQQLTPTVRGKITVEKIPRNMNSGRNANRRRKPGTLYADAAILPRSNTATLAVADPRGNVVRTASVYTTLTEHAEDAAIALAATGTKQDHITVITNSQRACRNFAKGEIGKPAARILSKAQFTSMKIVWAPGHAGIEGNEAANAAARAFHSIRDSSAPEPHTPDPNMKYNEYLKTIREARMTLPAPPSKFAKEEEHLYRRLQTGTMKTPMKLHQWYPQLHPSTNCSFCGWKWGDLYHLMWVCKHIKGLDPIPNPTKDSWHPALRWSDPGSQHWLVRRATVVQAAIGAPD
ncbi:hypothetical protein HPB47_022893 [Ixodes persulcatus]|uniref:Uncharacterized protein n=1 Tax=Ixodes persulcatus TaxID=34615 RepID=A0AC60QAQ5_IXOPE|nr:hypothetical protein HPB47_022893 [Ixodes persulcatus]